ncbi:MAG: hypothetical protein R3E32_12210 [Chitinophagales bacterium]
MDNKYSLQLLLFILFSLLWLDTSMSAQNIATFVDKHGRFKVFDNGKIQDLEHEEISEVHIGGDYVVYKDNIKQTKRYAAGEIEHITDDQKIKFYPTQYFMGVVEGLKGEILKVRYGDEEELLTIDLQRDGFAVGDSVLVFIDIDKYLSVYYKGDTEELTGRFPNADNFKVGCNSVAYIDPSGSFLIFHEGAIEEVSHREPAFKDDEYQYHVGDNFVVFVNEMDKLMAYDEGELTTLTEFVPKDYIAGDKIAAFVDDGGKYQVYWKGSVKELCPRPPKFQAIEDNTLAYVDDRGYLNVFDKGKNQVLETYQPKKIEVFNGIVAYLDLDGRLQAYYEGKKLKVSSEIVKDFRLVGRVILYTIGNDETKIFHDGNHYSG